MARKKERYCPKGHDTSIVGRTGGGCSLCQREKSRTRWKARIPPRSMHCKRGHPYTGNYCGTCRKAAVRLQRTGCDAVLYEKLLLLQDGKCAICLEPETRRTASGAQRALSADHDHTSGKVRGLLCNRCNQALGRFNDSPDLFIKAAEYLTSYSILDRE
jgi:hypothetical protein